MRATRRGCAEFAAALEEIGFAVLVGHGVDPALYEEMDEAGAGSLHFDSARREDALLRAERFGSVNQGYFPIEETSEIHPDLVEGWVFCSRAFDMPQERDAAVRAEDFLAAARTLSGSSRGWFWRTSSCSSRSRRRCSRGSAVIRICSTTS